MGRRFLVSGQRWAAWAELLTILDTQSGENEHGNESTAGDVYGRLSDFERQQRHGKP